MKLSIWAKNNGLSYLTALRLFKAGKLPCKSRQLATGTILVEEEPIESFEEKIVLYCRVSSNDQKQDLERQQERLKMFCASKGWKIHNSIIEIGSGLNGRRSRLLKILNDKSITHVVVEHKDRLALFGVEYIEAALAASNRTIVIINDSEYKNDLVTDFVDVVTSMCDRIYGRRSAKNKAQRALQAIQEKS